jgi:hypothetical protein
MTHMAHIQQLVEIWVCQAPIHLPNQLNNSKDIVPTTIKQLTFYVKLCLNVINDFHYHTIIKKQQYKQEYLKRKSLHQMQKKV